MQKSLLVLVLCFVAAASVPAQGFVDVCGTLYVTGFEYQSCLWISADHGGEYLIEGCDSCGLYMWPDTLHVRVAGNMSLVYFWEWPLFSCPWPGDISDVVYSIDVESIDLCEPPISLCGTILDDPDCIMFETDYGVIYEITSSGGFASGELVKVSGNLLPYITSACNPEASIIEVNAVSDVGCTCIGIRGNCDGDPNDEVTISDLTYFVDYLFAGGSPPFNMEEADMDGSGGLNITDLTYLVDYLFDGGPAPVMCP